MKDHKCIEDLEKERVRNKIGKIGGKKRSVYGRYVNTLFICIVLSVFFIKFLLCFQLKLATPYLAKDSLDGTSAKKVNHFQFWMLTSLEFRMNEISKKIKKAENESKIAEAS